MDFGYKKLYIGGKLQDAASKETLDVVCPATGEVVATVAKAGKADAELALIEAQKGFEYWSKLPLAERTAWMTKLRDAIIEREEDIRQALVYEVGKPYAGTDEDMEMLLDSLEFFPAAMRNMHDEIIPDYEGTHKHHIVNHPAGVAVAYLAWNFPILNVGYKIGPALAAGCSIVIKPSETTPLATYIIGEILEAIDFPAGVVNIIAGPVKDVALTMTKSTIPTVLTMIGSSASGKRVIEDSATSVKHVSLELGGNGPFVVCEDADIDKAVKVGVELKYGNSGQVCVSPNRFIVHEKVYDEFLAKFKVKTEQLKIGFGLDNKPDMGPLVTKRDQERILGMIQEDVAAGAELVLGGKVPQGLEDGYFIEPTILSGITQESRCFNEEIFGPVAPMMSFKTVDEAIEIANNTEYGLASYVFTQNEALVQRFAAEMDFGEVQFNGVKYAIYLPHGGIKESGIGHDCSTLALDDYLVKKRVTIAL